MAFINLGLCILVRRSGFDTYVEQLPLLSPRQCLACQGDLRVITTWINLTLYYCLRACASHTGLSHALGKGPRAFSYQKFVLLLCGACFDWLCLRYLGQPLHGRCSRVGFCHWPYDSTVVTSSRYLTHLNVRTCTGCCLCAFSVCWVYILLLVCFVSYVHRPCCMSQLFGLLVPGACFLSQVGLHVVYSVPLRALLVPATSAPSKCFAVLPAPLWPGSTQPGGAFLTGAVLVLGALSVRCAACSLLLFKDRSGDSPTSGVNLCADAA